MIVTLPGGSLRLPQTSLVAINGNRIGNVEEIEEVERIIHFVRTTSDASNLVIEIILEQLAD